MTSWILSLMMFAGLAAGLAGVSITADQDQDRIQQQDRDPIQDRLHDGSCKTSYLSTLSVNLNS